MMTPVISFSETGKMYDYTLRSLIHDVNLPVNHMGHNLTNKEFDSKFPEPDNNSSIFSKFLNGKMYDYTLRSLIHDVKFTSKPYGSQPNKQRI